MHRSLASLFSLLFLTTHSWADNWPAWRGPHANGVSTEQDLPVTWSATQNVRWKVPLPAPGNSTPIVWGDHVLLTQSLDGGKRRALMAFARRDGQKLWQQEVPCAVPETSHKQNPPCSGSPVTDGTAVTPTLLLPASWHAIWPAISVAPRTRSGPAQIWQRSARCSTRTC